MLGNPCSQGSVESPSHYKEGVQCKVGGPAPSLSSGKAEELAGGPTLSRLYSWEGTRPERK